MGLNPDFADRNIQVPRTFSVPLDSNTPSRFVSGTYTAAAEVLLDIGMLDFGKGVTAKANVAVCRTRGDEKQLVGEFAYQCKFKRRDERTSLEAVAMKRCEQFFCSPQLEHLS